jgi:hypothetical protein
VAHLFFFAKFLALAPLALVAAAFVLCLAPFVLAYFLFDRLCSLIEEFRPARKKSSRGNRIARIQSFLSYLPAKK